MKIEHEVTIDAPPSRVWNTFCEFERYADWNPFIIRASGAQEVGRTLDIVIVTPGGREVRFSPVVTELEPGQKMTWVTNGALPGLFNRKISFEFEDLGAGKTRFVHSGEFTGLLVTLRKGVIEDLKLGYDRMNEALRKRCTVG